MPTNTKFPQLHDKINQQGIWEEKCSPNIISLTSQTRVGAKSSSSALTLRYAS